MTDPTPIRRLAPTPAWLIFGLLVVEGLLWLSERYAWFWFNERKGWTVLIGVASVGVVMLLMLGWFIVALVFRWRFQFSIRSLLVLVVVVALPFSWLAVEMANARQQREAAAAIVESLGVVKWSASSGPAWLRDLLGKGFCEHVEYVGFFGPFGKLENLKALTHLKSFHTASSPTTDSDLPCLTELPLEELSLCGSNLSDVGLDHLKTFRRLKVLDVRYSEVTDEGVKKLQQALPNCQIYH